ncbi:MAG: hypothetical protein KDE24_23170 [Caldilinea sp.]|nr:hypothetical protein [Caldilinea sp.]
MNGHHRKSREIGERVHVSGIVTLRSPAHFGNGAVRGDALVDMSLLLDEVDGTPTIPGTTIAGALRCYLRERLGGYRQRREDPAIVALFGPARGDDDDAGQSLLIVDDAVVVEDDGGTPLYATTLRDGVRVDPRSNLAYYDEESRSGAKFDLEVLEAGTRFAVHLELLGTAEQPADRLLPYVIEALAGLDSGEIRLGLRKRRGFGRLATSAWRMSRYRLDDPQDLCAWLETPAWAHKPGSTHASARDLLPGTTALADARQVFRLEADFTLDGSSLLVRSGAGLLEAGPDVEQLHMLLADGTRQPVIPGTSWAGVLRHRAVRIANTIAAAGNGAAPDDTAARLVDELFGWTPARGQEVTGSASRLLVDDSVVAEGQPLVQTRVGIDRFTGGALETRLFEEAPIYGRTVTKVPLSLLVQNPTGADIGLILLLLKDLWTQDLPVGGEASVGRGRLTGLRATMTLPDTDEALELAHDRPALGLDDGARTTLAGFVDELWSRLASDAAATVAQGEEPNGA